MMLQYAKYVAAAAATGNLFPSLPQRSLDEAGTAIARTLRADLAFMADLKRFGIYDEDAASIIEDLEDVEE